MERAASRRKTRLVASFALLAYAFFGARYDRVTDAAYIAFRYARHLARGFGLTFNPGVDPPVEGFSSPMWVFAIAPFEALDLDPTLAARAISFACGAWLLWRLARLFVEELELDVRAASAAVLWTAVMPAFPAWASGGQETMTFALLAFLGYQALIAGRRASGLRGGLCGVAPFLCRFDGLGWALATCAFAWAIGRRRRDAGRERTAVIALAVIAVGCAAIELARVLYCGDPLPNTARAKAGASLAQLDRGLDFVARFFAISPTSAAVAGAVLVRARPLRTPARLRSPRRRSHSRSPSAATSWRTSVFSWPPCRCSRCCSREPSIAGSPPRHRGARSLRPSSRCSPPTLCSRTSASSPCGASRATCSPPESRGSSRFPSTTTRARRAKASAGGSSSAG
jgi:hypothetical protein